MRAFKTLLKTELRLSLRGMDMVIFALCMPLAVVVVLGAVFGGKPAFGGAGDTFLERSFGAVSAIAICAGGVMGLPLVIADYRGKKILKRFQVTPTSPATLLFVQVAIYALYAVASLALVYGAATLLFGMRFMGSAAAFLGAYLLVLVSMFSIGVLVGGLARDYRAAGMLASLLYFPMLVFSGATLPYEVMPPVMQRIADAMPLTQGIKLLKAASLGLPAEGALLPAAVMAALALVCGGVALRKFRWE